MRLIQYLAGEKVGIAAAKDGEFKGWTQDDSGFPGTLDQLVGSGSDSLKEAAAMLLQGHSVDLDEITLLPPLTRPGKIICIGLNYHAHMVETGRFADAGNPVPTYPTVFTRFATTLIGHDVPIIKPDCSDQLDWEGELVAVIGKSGRNISKDEALDHVCAYSIFNDASIRDYQRKTTQFTMGKNFDATGPFGPWLVTADDLPPGAGGLSVTTRVNSEVMQSGSTDQMIFDVPTLVSTLSEVFTLEPGDIIVTGTPEGVGAARTPPVFMKAGDVCEIEIEQIGTLRNPVELQD